MEKVELAPSVVRTGELLKRTCESIGKRFQEEESKSQSDSREGIRTIL
jgi:hypothetical protein